MELILLRVFLLCSVFVTVLGAGSELSCEGTDEDIYVENYDRPICYCYGPGNNQTTFDWTLVHHSGRREHLATCCGVDNCTNFFPSDLQISLGEDYSSLSFHNLAPRFSGILWCTQTNSTFSGSVSRTINVTLVRVNDCKDVSIRETGGSEDVNCNFSPYTPSTVTWSFTTHSGQSLHLGTCRSSDDFMYACNSSMVSNVTLSAGSSYSGLYFIDEVVTRDMAAVVCSVTFPNATEASNCTLNIFNPATVENCSLHVSRHNWSFVVQFDIINDFNTEDLYEFQVFEAFNLLRRDQLVVAEGNAFVAFRSYRHFVVSYINSTNKRLYYRGRVVYSWPMSPYPGTYSSFRIETTHYGTNAVNYEQGFNISLPARPTHNCNEVTTPCFCSTETLGSPEGRLLWLIGNTTVAVGDYGVRQLLLPSDKLSDGQDVVIATCELDWIHRLISDEPAILRRTFTDQYKSMAVAGWTLWCVVIVLNVVCGVILVRQWSIIGNKSTDEQEDEVASPSYARLKTSTETGKNKSDDTPTAMDHSEASSS